MEGLRFKDRGSKTKRQVENNQITALADSTIFFPSRSIRSKESRNKSVRIVMQEADKRVKRRAFWCPTQDQSRTIRTMVMKKKSGKVIAATDKPKDGSKKPERGTHDRVWIRRVSE